MSFGNIKIDPFDSAVSWIVRTKANWRCERCKTYYPPPTRALHCSHWEGRSNLKTRWDLDNLSSLCHGCHAYFTAHPEEYRGSMIKKLGEKRFEELNRRANWRTKEKIDKKLIELWLRQELKKVGLNENDFFMKKEKSFQCAAHKFVNCIVCSPRKKPEKKKTKSNAINVS